MRGVWEVCIFKLHWNVHNKLICSAGAFEEGSKMEEFLWWIRWPLTLAFNCICWDKVYGTEKNVRDNYKVMLVVFWEIYFRINQYYLSKNTEQIKAMSTMCASGSLSSADAKDWLKSCYYILLHQWKDDTYWTYLMKLKNMVK